MRRGEGAGFRGTLGRERRRGSSRPCADPTRLPPVEDRPGHDTGGPCHGGVVPRLSRVRSAWSARRAPVAPTPGRRGCVRVRRGRRDPRGLVLRARPHRRRLPRHRRRRNLLAGGIGPCPDAPLDLARTLGVARRRRPLPGSPRSRARILAAASVVSPFRPARGANSDPAGPGRRGRRAARRGDRPATGPPGKCRRGRPTGRDLRRTPAPDRRPPRAGPLRGVEPATGRPGPPVAHLAPGRSAFVAQRSARGSGGGGRPRADQFLLRENRRTPA